MDTSFHFSKANMTTGSYGDSFKESTRCHSAQMSHMLWHDYPSALDHGLFFPIASWQLVKVASPDFPLLSHLETSRPSPQGRSPGLTQWSSWLSLLAPQALPACTHCQVQSWKHGLHL